MTAARSILGLFFVITMVLLPYGHMPFHAPHATSVSDHHGCSHTHHEPEPDDGQSPEHSHSCPLCQLTLLSAEPPQVFTTVWWVIHLDVQEDADDLFIEAPIIRDPQARAPPAATEIA